MFGMVENYLITGIRIASLTESYVVATDPELQPQSLIATNMDSTIELLGKWVQGLFTCCDLFASSCAWLLGNVLALNRELIRAHPGWHLVPPDTLE